MLIFPSLPIHYTIIIIIIIIILFYFILLTAIGLSPGGSGYITCTQVWKEKSN